MPDLVSQRILAGWPLGWVAWAAALALAGTWAAASAGVMLNIIWLGAILISILVFSKLFILKQRATRLMLAVSTLLLVGLLVAYFLQIQTV
jgi:hypothetical protein